MENKSNNSGGLGSGFMLGLLIGVLITILITTKKGREILRDIMDKIIHKLSKIDESIDKIKEELQKEEESDFIKSSPQDIKDEVRAILAEAVEDSEKPVRSTPKTDNKTTTQKNGKEDKQSKRLFFRRTHKN